MHEAESFTTRRALRLGIANPMQRQLEAIDALTTQILAADVDMQELAEADDICAQLMSVPGIGPQTVLRFKCSSDQVERSPSAAQLESYVGLTPGEDSSSERKRRTAINKAGDATLIQSAWTMRLCRPNDPIVQWNNEVEKRAARRWPSWRYRGRAGLALRSEELVSLYGLREV